MIYVHVSWTPGVLLKEPQQITLGSVIRSVGTGKRQMKRRVGDTFLYIPILEVIQSLFNNSVFSLEV